MDYFRGTIISCYKFSKAIALGTAFEWNGVSRLAQPWVCSLPSVLGKINSFLYHSKENIKMIWPSHPKERNKCLEVFFQTMLSVLFNLWCTMRKYEHFTKPHIDPRHWSHDPTRLVEQHGLFILAHFTTCTFHTWPAKCTIYRAFSISRVLSHLVPWGVGYTSLWVKSFMHVPLFLTVVCSPF